MASMKKLLDKSGLPFSREPAVNGRLVTDVQLCPKARAIVYGNRKEGHSDLDSLGAVGCSLSHMNVWRRIMSGDEDVALVLEDDATWDGRLEIPDMAGADIVFLGFLNEFPEGDMTPWPLGDLGLGSHAYLVTRSFASRLFANAFPLCFSIDAYMQSVVAAEKARARHVPLVRQRFWLERTDIQHKPIEETPRNYWFWAFWALVTVVVCNKWLQSVWKRR